MARKKKHEEHVNLERWLISYADFITLMFAFFVVMFSVSQVDTRKLGKFSESFSQNLGIDVLDGQRGVFDGQPHPYAWNNRGGGSGQVGRGTALNKIQKNLSQKLKEQRGIFKGERTKGRKKVGRPKEMGDVGLRVLRRRQELVLRLDHDVLFGSGDDQLRPIAFDLLSLIAETVRGQDVEVRVEGHTDNVPIFTERFRSNWHLSTARATAVILFFSERGGVAPDRLAAAGYGEHQPIASNDTESGRSKNRRVDIVITQREPIEPLTEAEPEGDGSKARPERGATPTRDGTGFAKPQGRGQGTKL